MSCLLPTTLSATVLLAARFGRLGAEAERLGLDYWKRRQQWLSSADGQVHQARLAYEKERAARRKAKEAEIILMAQRAREAAAERDAARQALQEAKRAAQEELARQQAEWDQREAEIRAEVRV